MWKFPYYEVDRPIDWQNLKRISWIADMQGVEQDSEWHAEGDVFTHTKMVVESLIQLPEFQILPEQEKHLLVAAALLHDVEKRSTTQREEIDGKIRITSPKHAKKGELTARSILYREIPTPFNVREQIAKLVRLHGLPLWAITKSNPAQAVVKASLSLNTQHLAMLAKADVLGRICPDQADLLLDIDLFKALCVENECWGTARQFASDYGRYLYLNRDNALIDYQPFEDQKFQVHMLCALPGSGKDYFIAKHFADLPVVSLDDIRRHHHIDPTDKKQSGKVIQLAKEACKILMREDRSFVFNATNITSEMRGKWCSLFESYGAKICIHYIEVPYKQLLAQNHNRQYKVPENALERLLDKLEIPDWDEAHHIEYHIEERE